MGTPELSETAFLIAYGRSTDPKLSLDVYANLWLSEKGIQFSKKFSQYVTPLAPFLFCLRNRYVTEQLKTFERKFPNFTLINVGAGLTSYPFLLSDTVSTVYLDQSHVIEYFRTHVDKFVAAGKLPKRDITYLPINLSTDDGLVEFGDLLSKHSQPVFVLFEGILTYLPKPRALQFIKACADKLCKSCRVEVHVGLDNFSSSKTWKRTGHFFNKELELPLPQLTLFDEQEITNIPGLKLIEHVGFRDIQKRAGVEKDFDDEQLIDERFFLLEKM